MQSNGKHNGRVKGILKLQETSPKYCGILYYIDSDNNYQRFRFRWSTAFYKKNFEIFPLSNNPHRNCIPTKPT